MNVLQMLKEFLLFTRDFIRNYWQTFVGLYVLLSTVVSWFVEAVNAGAASALTYLGQLAVPELSGGSWSFAASGFAFLNSFLPVSESVSLAVALAALYVSAIGYRFVKSWIPTLT